MGLRINDIAPNFTANSTAGELTLHDWIGDKYAILFSHPKDFTPVCTTEFGAVAQLAPEFAKRNTKVMGVSVDSVEDHKKWKLDIEKFSGSPADFPIIDDTSLKVAKAFDMLPAEAYLPDGRTPAHSATVRTVFIIGPDKKIRLSMTYPMAVGRNFAEILRALDAVQLSDGAPLATPANWTPGQDVIVGMGLNDEQAKEKYGSIDIKLPYLRFTKAPKLYEPIASVACITRAPSIRCTRTFPKRGCLGNLAYLQGDPADDQRPKRGTTASVWLRASCQVTHQHASLARSCTLFLVHSKRIKEAADSCPARLTPLFSENGVPGLETPTTGGPTVPSGLGRLRKKHLGGC
jgi:thioredoxin-dependent peroxiredoxin